MTGEGQVCTWETGWVKLFFSILKSHQLESCEKKRAAGVWMSLLTGFYLSNGSSVCHVTGLLLVVTAVCCFFSESSSDSMLSGCCIIILWICTKSSLDDWKLSFPVYISLSLIRYSIHNSTSASQKLHIFIFPHIKILTWNLYLVTVLLLNALVWFPCVSQHTQSLFGLTPDTAVKEMTQIQWGYSLLGLIFVGISSRFKLYNVINGREQEEQRIPQRQQEIAVAVSSSGSLDLKAFTLQTRRNSKLKKCNIRTLSWWHLPLAAGPFGHWQTRQLP